MSWRYFEDFHPGEIIELGSTQVSQEEIITFARQYDPQPFHTDPEKAKESFWGGIIASGWHTACLFMRMYVDTILIHSESIASPGLENLKWIKPVRPGDTLHARFTVLEVKASQSKPNLGIVKSRSEVYNQHGEVVMAVEALNFFGRRPV